MEGDENSSSFPMGNTAQEKGLSYVPQCYKVPSSSRPSLDPETANIPVIDMALLRAQDSEKRTSVIKQIGNACRQVGFFQVVNHAIPQSVLDEALASAFKFFELPTSEKKKYMSNDVKKPVRYSTSIKDGMDKVQFWRVFLKHYAHPLSDWIHLWPENPPLYREKMGKYCSEARKLALELMGAIIESLGLGPNYLANKFHDGVQVMALNCYPPCPNPQVTLGLPSHSDYSCITIVHQSSQGLEIMGSEDKKWRAVPMRHGALQVHVGDHLQVLCNGIYKSVVHRAVLNPDRARISLASLHSLGMDEKMRPAKELVDDQNPEKYKESSFRDFLDFLSKNDFAEGKSFIETLKSED